MSTYTPDQTPDDRHLPIVEPTPAETAAYEARMTEQIGNLADPRIVALVDEFGHNKATWILDDLHQAEHWQARQDAAK